MQPFLGPGLRLQVAELQRPLPGRLRAGEAEVEHGTELLCEPQPGHQLLAGASAATTKITELFPG